MDRLQWWRLPFLFPSWSPWYLKVNQLLVLPLMAVEGIADLAAGSGPGDGTAWPLCLTAAGLGLFLANVDTNVESYVLDQRMRLKLGDDW